MSFSSSSKPISPPKVPSSSSTSNSNANHHQPNKDWLECAKWLDNLNILPAKISSQLAANQLTLQEFANALRDGEILCLLANHLIPGCIDSALIQKQARAQKSQLLCLNNIRLFLDVCKSYFGLREADLFGEHMLYDLVDLGCVLRTLSVIGRSELAVRRTGLHGFILTTPNSNNNTLTLPNTPSRTPSDASNSSSSNKRLSNSLDLQLTSHQHHHNNNNKDLSNSDDIYYNIVPTESDFSPTESNYTDDTFFNPLQYPSSTPTSSQDHVYDIIVKEASTPQQQQQPMRRDFVMREILNTEENFVGGLNTLWKDFLAPLSKVLNEQDRKCICINLDKLIQLHTRLLNALTQACKGGHGRTQRICNVFDSFKVELMKEYAEYFSSIDRSLAKCDSLTQPSSSSVGDAQKQQYLNEFRQKLDECRKKSKQGSYKLTDLLRLPYQRILKYHLLFGELLKQTDVEHSAKDLIEQTKASMSEVGNYLNECQRDKENLSFIEQLTKHLILNNGGDGKSSSSVYSNSLNLNLLKDYGHYIKDDKFMIKSNDTSASTRSLFLFEKALIVCKSKGNFYNYKETILINEYRIEDPQTAGSALGGPLASSSSSNINVGGLLSNLSAINPNLSSSSISLNPNQSLLYLINIEKPEKFYQFIFKNKDKKKVWKSALLSAKDKVKPDGYRINKHQFELSNFDRDLVKCFVCDKYLLGLFYQGYTCRLCNVKSHKECLTKSSNTSICQAVNQSPPPTTIAPPNSGAVVIPPQPVIFDKPPVASIKREPSNRSHTSSIGSGGSQVACCAKAIYKYDGRPAPPLVDYPPLLFSQGEFVQVTDDDDDDWWRGYIMQSNGKTPSSPPTSGPKEEGYFPRRHVKVVKFPSSHLNSDTYSSQSNLDDYPWFSPVDRTLAELILERLLSHDPSQTLFMVRRRQEGGFAISIRYNGTVDHIKINLTDINNSTAQLIIFNDQQPSPDQQQTYVFSIDQQHNFDSIVSLVNYYSIHVLKDNFPQLDTTLGMPYRQALPQPISSAIAMHDFTPQSATNITGEQIELVKMQRYYVLNKELNGWWRVFNQEGLIGYVPGSYLNESKSQVEA